MEIYKAIQLGIFFCEILKNERRQLLLEKLTNSPPTARGFFFANYPLSGPTR